MDFSNKNHSLWLLPDAVVREKLLQLTAVWREFHQLDAEEAPVGHDILHAIHWENPDKVGEGHIDVAEDALRGREFNPLATYLQEEGLEWEDSLQRVYNSTLSLHPVVKRVILKEGLLTF